MSQSSLWSIARFVAWRNLRVLFRSRALLLPALLFPLLILIAFAGALSSLTNIPALGTDDYTAFIYVFALLQSAGLTGAMGGFAMAQDWEGGFMRRLWIAAPSRSGIVMGYVLAMLARGLLAAALLTGVAFGFGMGMNGSVIEIIGLYGLALLFNVVATLWAAGVSMRIRSFKAAPGMALPIFLLLFLAPVFVPLSLLSGWLHAVAVVNPFTRFLEAGRGFIAGEPKDVALAFGLAVSLTILACLWAFLGLRRAQAAGV